MKKFYIIILILSAFIYNAQVGIGTNNPNDGSILHMEGNGSLLLPRVSLSSLTDTSIIPVGSSDTLQKGMMLYNINTALSTTGEGIYYWDGAKWVMLALNTGTAPASSIFYKTTTTNNATSVTDNVYHQGAVTLGTASGHNVSEDGAMLNLEAKDKGLLLNRVSLVTRNSPAPLVAAGNPMEAGMLVYNTNSSFEDGIGPYFWDGTNWNVLVSQKIQNEGVVKVNAYNDGTSKQPTFSFHKNPSSNLDQFLPIIYDTSGTNSLEYDNAVTQWPENILSPTDANIYNSTYNTFLENPIAGQVHHWRINLYYEGVSIGARPQISIKLRNPVSGFEIEQSEFSKNGNASGFLTFLLTTIADVNSIQTTATPGPLDPHGYELAITSDTEAEITILNITRVSTQKD